MKKFFSTLICALIVSGCACALSACTVKAPVEQINDMAVKSVAQSADGSVKVTVDVSGVDFSDDTEGNEKSYYIQPSLDGGQSWFGRSVYLAQSEVENGEFSFKLIEYASYDGNYYLLGQQDEAGRLSLSAGDKIEVSLRFSAHDNYLASDPTQPVEYVFKSLTEFGIFTASVEENLPISDDTQYIFAKRDDSFKLFKLVGSESELSEAEAEIIDRLEYKFISESDLEADNASVLNGALKELENSSQTGGWIAYSAENGITRADCEGKLINKVDAQFEYEYALVMVRLKETDAELKSEVALVYLYLKNEINEDYSE